MDDRRLAYSALLAATSLVILAVAAKASQSFDQADLNAALWINGLRLGSAVSSLMVDASLYGREYFWIPVAGIMLAFGDRRTKLVAVGLCAVFAGGVVLGTVAKDLVARARPDQLLSSYGGGVPILRLPLDTDYSFPSGHAVIVSVGAAYSLATFRNRWAAWLVTVEAAVVCFSRVFLFEHFPTDVIAGVALGVAIALGGLLIGRRYLRRWAVRIADLLVKLMRSGPLKL